MYVTKSKIINSVDHWNSSVLGVSSSSSTLLRLYGLRMPGIEYTALR